MWIVCLGDAERGDSDGRRIICAKFQLFVLSVSTAAYVTACLRVSFLPFPPSVDSVST